jgi:hypothetical protein
MDLSFSDILEPYSPQYYGIIAGCIVYVVTVTSVIVLLVKSGTFSRMREQVCLIVCFHAFGPVYVCIYACMCMRAYM